MNKFDKVNILEMDFLWKDDYTAPICNFDLSKMLNEKMKETKIDKCVEEEINELAKTPSILVIVRGSN
jgi:hypothetical protein